jgi:ABC-type lipoprotein export system ATPase subunit
MTTILRGSTWKKWDLHVHTPESLVHNYPGEKEAAWEAFLADLEALPAEFKVLGINDYLFVDGYERVLRAKQQGRLANIELLLPVVELRLDKFGGVLEQGPDGYLPSPWSRINLHVIFDQVDPALIREQFMPALSRRYTLVPGATGQWGGVLTRENLIALGEAVISSMPEADRAKAPSQLKAGFNNLNISYDDLKDALVNPHLAGKHLIAIGKSEWDSLRWNDHTIADKKTVINEANLVFTAAANPEAYVRARNALKGANVNANLLDCSDAHSLSATKVKDRIGNCFTWIKADSTFQGLLQAIQEFDDRVFVGDDPPKRQIVEQNKTKFISSVKVVKKDDSTLAEPWFDADIPLNPDLVAIIGNKGSGKSALSDIIALAGNTKHHKGFSFLKDSRFRGAKTKYAQHFVGALTWHDGTETARDLDKDPEPSSVERVKYLPQSYVEDLCNELGDGGSATFDAELRKIIYSHVPEADRLGKPSMDELLEFKVAEINQARQVIRKELGKVNEEIIEVGKRSTPEFRKSLEEQLAAKKAELASLEAGKPQVVEDPNASAEALEESKQAAKHIDTLEQQVKEIDENEARLRGEKATATKRQAVAKRIAQALANHKKQHEAFIGEMKALLAELGVDIPLQALIELKVDPGPVDAVFKEMQAEIERTDTSLQSVEPDSLSKRREELVAAISEATGKLGEQERQFVLYKEALAKWEKSTAEIMGTRDKPESIAWLTGEIESLASLPARLDELRARRTGLSRDIHGHIQAMVDEYQRLYGPVQSFVNSDEQKDMKLPLDFHVQIEESGFQDQFLGRLSRQVRGSFSGVEESNQLVRGLLNEVSFASVDAALAFAAKIDDMLRFDHREGQQNRESRLEDQLRRGGTSQDLLDYVFGFEYLSPRYSLTYAGQEIGQLSPGERGLLLLVFYLLVDKDDIPIVIDQPEENLDNQTIFRVLVKCIKKAKERRQVIMVTHNPNLAVVCDAEQLIHASCDKAHSRFIYESGAMENHAITSRVVEILEGTAPAFKNRQSKYRLQ